LVAPRERQHKKSICELTYSLFVEPLLSSDMRRLELSGVK